MTDEEKKRRYRNIVYNLNIINNKIDNLSNNISSLNNSLSNNLIINNKGYKSDELNNIRYDLNRSSDYIRNNIISNLNRKIYN